MSTLRKILTKSEDGQIQIETSSKEGMCELQLESGEAPFEIDEVVLIGAVVEYGQERGILVKPRQRKAAKARKPRRDKGTSRTAAAAVEETSDVSGTVNVAAERVPAV